MSNGQDRQIADSEVIQAIVDILENNKQFKYLYFKHRLNKGVEDYFFWETTKNITLSELMDLKQWLGRFNFSNMSEAECARVLKASQGKADSTTTNLVTTFFIYQASIAILLDKLGQKIDEINKTKQILNCIGLVTTPDSPIYSLAFSYLPQNDGNYGQYKDNTEWELYYDAVKVDFKADISNYEDFVNWAGNSTVPELLNKELLYYSVEFSNSESDADWTAAENHDTKASTALNDITTKYLFNLSLVFERV